MQSDKTRRWLFSKSGLTLVELLISTAIVGLIMVGMVSVDYAMRSSEQQLTRSALVALRTTAMMNDIVNSAMMAIGDTSDPGIIISNIANNNSNRICFRHDLDSSGAALDTPWDYSDDRWVCYTRRTNDLHKCILNTPNQCNAATPILGTVTTDVYDAPDTPVFLVDSTQGVQNYYFQITLKNRYDAASRTYGAAADDAIDTFVNPKFKLTSRVSPSGCRL